MEKVGNEINEARIHMGLPCGVSSDRIAIIHNGQILDCDSPQELIKNHINLELVEEKIKPGIVWKRPPNIEDVYLKLAGRKLD